MRVLITGDRGFVGTATKLCLEQNGHDVIGFDLMDRKDVRDKNTFETCVKAERPDRILHLAAVARFADADADPILAWETNAVGSRNVSRVASAYHIPVVYSSTGSVYMPIKQKPPITEEFTACGNSQYGCSKYVGELYIRQSYSPWMILRYAHLYGNEKRGHGLVGGFLDRIQRGLAPKLYGGKQSNDFTYILDVAEANYLALMAPADKWKQVYNIGTGEELDAHSAGKMVCEAFGYDGKMEVQEQRTVDPDRFVFDCSKAERMLGFKAEFDFETGLLHMKNEMVEVPKRAARA